MRIPKLKKKISAYILGEEGKISKQSMMALGSLLGTAAVGEIVSALPTNCPPTGTPDCPGAPASMTATKSQSGGMCTTNCYHANSLAAQYDSNNFDVRVQHGNCIDHCSY
ncbi:hypothetical protein H6504_00825 [Candidatus Woesearchaeota archaeon]|nr:hypothetical protein [Candidatus Woesearchaeota archaeon]